MVNLVNVFNFIFADQMMKFLKMANKYLLAYVEKCYQTWSNCPSLTSPQFSLLTILVACCFPQRSLELQPPSGRSQQAQPCTDTAPLAWSSNQYNLLHSTVMRHCSANRLYFWAGAVRMARQDGSLCWNECSSSNLNSWHTHSIINQATCQQKELGKVRNWIQRGSTADST